MRRFLVHHSIAALIVLLAVAPLYKYWLTVPVLQHVTVSQWRVIGITAAGTIAAVSSLRRMHTLVFVAAFGVGLLLGGTWAELSFPSDVETSLWQQFGSHLATLWREVLLLFVTAIAGRFLCERALRRFAGTNNPNSSRRPPR